ncbi:transposase [Bacillus thuringiensis serovar pingluonsis]|uniref:Transposase n=1 Tax=Bacillus thuringiensis serovar pingluonsis TaxID=180881 RepID=A0A243BPR1_BACTU|nr:transposase [Bacillus thuringiensis serovar pingluonsis]
MMNKAYKFRIYPNQAQAILINKTIGCSRFVFNHFLSLWDQAYKETGKGLTYGTRSAKLPAMYQILSYLISMV